jgi:hypothetical protein
MVKAARAFAPVPADAASIRLEFRGLVSVVRSTHRVSKLSSLSKTTFFWSLNSSMCLHKISQIETASKHLSCVSRPRNPVSRSAVATLCLLEVDQAPLKLLWHNLGCSLMWSCASLGSLRI